MKAIQTTVALLTGVALLLAVVLPSFWAFRQIKVAADARKHSYEVIHLADTFLSGVKDAETGQRGYTLTGDESFLGPYLAVRDSVRGQLDELRQRTLISAARQHLDALAPLMDAKLAELSNVIELRRNNDMPAVQAAVGNGQGKRLMDSIRAEMDGFTQIEEEALVRRDAEFQSSMRYLLGIIVTASLFALLCVLSFAYFISREARQRLKNAVHLETQHLLASQKEMNEQLRQTNISLQVSEEKLAVTLTSIGDAVITTDADGRVTLLNPLAEKLTGWPLAEAAGHPVDEIVHIINRETRQLSAVPVMDTLAHGTIQGLINHTILIARDGSECAIADSCAPICDRDGLVVGAVLVFRDATSEYTALRTSEDRFKTMFMQAPLGIALIDSFTGHIYEANARFAEIAGRSMEDLVTHDWLQITHPDDAQADLDNMALLNDGKVRGFQVEKRYLHPDGTTVWINMTVAPLQVKDMASQRHLCMIQDITETRRQKALIETGALQNAIFNSANFSSIATDAKGVIQIFNVGAERMLGYTAAEVMNKITPAAISDPQELIARAASLSIEFGTPITPGFEALVFKASRGIEDIYELTYIRKDRSRFPAVVSVTALRDAQDAIIGYLLIGTDNTARKQAEDALQKAGALQNAIVNSENFSSIATDAKGVIQLFNVGAERMLGYTANDVLDKITPADISDPEEVIARAKILSIELKTPITPGFEALVFKASRGIEDIYELTYIRKDGSRFPAVVSVTALRDAQAAIIGYLLIGTDNTARKQVEAEQKMLGLALQEKNVELENAKIVAEKANLAKSEFLSSMSHELRSPLNAILGFTQLMESDPLPPTPSQKESLAQILQAGWHLLKLIDEVLDLTKIESKQVPMSQEPVLLAEVMLECQGMIEPQAQQHGIAIIFPPYNIPYYVKADRTRVKQVIINLLSNAIKYNREQGTVEVICTERAPGRIRVSIKDTGVGLSSEQMEQLFQPFNRLGQEAGGQEGTGIGLVVAKRLVELMGGVVGVESSVGVGSMFWFELDSADAPEFSVEEAEPLTPAKSQEKIGLKGHTLLYVEDNPANMKLVEQLVARRPDISLLTAVNGHGGIEVARASQPTAILMDINLPDISGFEVLRLLREDPAISHIPVVALSANAMPRDVERGLQAGFFGYMTKPIKISEFMDMLDAVMEFAEQAESTANKSGNLS